MIMIFNALILILIIVFGILLQKNLTEIKGDESRSTSKYNDKKFVYVIVISICIIFLLFINSIIDRSILVAIGCLISLIRVYFIMVENKK